MKPSSAFLLLSFFVLVSGLSNGQVPSPDEVAAQIFSQFTPSQIPTTQSEHLINSSNIDISYYTGTVNFSVDLFTIEASEFSYPFLLCYNSGGIKVGDQASWVGLGWDLNETKSLWIENPEVRLKGKK